MTTTFIDFTPQANQNFQFQPTLDGAVYTAIVTWNVFGERYYVNLYALDGTLIFCLPMTGSPLGYDISLTGGYFTTKLVFRAPNNQFEVID